MYIIFYFIVLFNIVVIKSLYDLKCVCNKLNVFKLLF